jgi:hypothetical protein
MTDNRRISLEARLIRKWAERDALARKLADMDRANDALAKEVGLGRGYCVHMRREALEVILMPQAARGEGRA